MPASKKKQHAAPSGPELFARIQGICQTADHSSLTKKGVRLLLADDFGKTFVEANKEAIGKMVLEAVKKMTAKKKSSRKATPGTPSGKAAAAAATAAPAQSQSQSVAEAPTKRKRKSADADSAPSSAKRRAGAAGSKAKARAATVRAMADVAAEEPEKDAEQTMPASQPDDEPEEPDTTPAKRRPKPAAKGKRKKKLSQQQQQEEHDAAADAAASQREAEMEQLAASLAPPRPAGVVSAVWAAASQTAGLRNNATANAAKRRQKQLDKAVSAVAAARSVPDSEQNAAEQLRSAARMAAPFPTLSDDVAELNERADALEEAERTRVEEQARKEAEVQQRKEQEQRRRTKATQELRAERAKIARAAREARRVQQEKDDKMREWEDERRAVEQATWHSQKNNLDDPIPEEDEDDA
jgi:hypothetical protein